MERLETFSLWMAAFAELIVSKMLRISLDCSVVVALMNSHSFLMLLLTFALSAPILLVW